MKTQCNFCGSRFTVNDEYLGRSQPCPKCKQKFVIAKAKPRLQEKPIQDKSITEPQPSVPVVAERSETIQFDTPTTTTPIQVNQAVYVGKNEQKPTSGLGIAALVLGILAFLTCWIPFIGMLGVPLAVLGLILGLVGLILAAHKKKTGIGMPLAGGIISLMSIIIAVVMTGTAAVAIDEAINQSDSIASGNIGDGSNPTLPTYNNAAEQEKLSYIKNYVQLYDIEAMFHESVLDGRIPGVDFKIKNLGNRTLIEVEVTVYFKNAAGIIIAEEDYHPVLTSSFMSDSKPLKPNYIWQQESGKFYAAKSVPSEWQEGNVVVQITGIEFEK